MIDQKSVIIGFIVSLVLVLALGFIFPIGQFIAVLIGAMIAGYLANKKTPIKVVEAALHGILVGIFTGMVQILVVLCKIRIFRNRSKYSNNCGSSVNRRLYHYRGTWRDSWNTVGVKFGTNSP